MRRAELLYINITWLAALFSVLTTKTQRTQRKILSKSKLIMQNFQPHPQPLPKALGRVDTALREGLSLKLPTIFSTPPPAPPRSFGEGSLSDKDWSLDTALREGLSLKLPTIFSTPPPAPPRSFGEGSLSDKNWALGAGTGHVDTALREGLSLKLPTIFGVYLPSPKLWGGAGGGVESTQKICEI